MAAHDSPEQVTSNSHIAISHKLHILIDTLFDSALAAMDVLNRLVAEKPVVIFTKSSCCISHSVKQIISSYGANATVYQLEDLPNGQEVEKALQRLGLGPSIPAVFIGQKLVGGAKEVITLQVQGRLTPLLKEARAIWV